MNTKLQEQLVEKAAEAAKKSYAPYSKFHVGAALLVAGKPAGNPPVADSLAGRRMIITGCNVENASFGLTICAERAALAAAVSAGFRRFEAIAVVTSGTWASPPRLRQRLRRGENARGKAVVPCGACLQALAEFCKPDLLILAASAASPARIKIFKLRDLLPYAFRFRS